MAAVFFTVTPEIQDLINKALGEDAIRVKEARTQVVGHSNEHPYSFWYRNYWSGGYYDRMVLVKREGLEWRDLNQALPSSPMSTNSSGYFELQKGFFVIKLCYRGTARKIIEFIVRADEMDTLSLPQALELTDNEITALYCIRTYKNSYAGQKECRRAEFLRLLPEVGIAGWDNTIQELQSKGLLDKRKSLTTEGKNQADGLNTTWDRENNRLKVVRPD